MKGTKANTHKENAQESKIGTWISVGVVAAVILITYFVMFGLYMDRV